jgi:two-component system cell cycle response regulator CpdR
VNKQTPNILIVEDDEAMRAFLMEAMSRSGYAAEAVTNGSEALSRIEAEPFDLLLTDIRMPGLDGLELVRKVREHNPKLGILLVTAFAQDALGVEHLDGTRTDVLSKPFNLNELLDRVGTILPY